jgi:hypothetical protein
MTQAGLHRVVHAVDLAPGLVEGHAAAHHLQAEVVLLVDHDADRLAGVEGDAAGAFEDGGQLPADELPLDEELAVERGHPGDGDVFGLVRVEFGAGDGVLDLGLDLGLLVVRGPPGERELGEVAGQAQPGGDDHVDVRAGPAEPLAQVRQQAVEVHPRASFCRIRSRSRAASS